MRRAALARLAWLVWCVSWAIAWAGCCALAWPRPACVDPMLIVINGRTCAQWGTTGNTGAAWVFAILAAASLLAFPAGAAPGILARRPPPLEPLPHPEQYRGEHSGGVW